MPRAAGRLCRRSATGDFVDSSATLIIGWSVQCATAASLGDDEFIISRSVVHVRPLSVTSSVLYERLVSWSVSSGHASRMTTLTDHSSVVSHSASRRTDLTSWFPCHDYCCWQNDAQLIIIICCRLTGVFDNWNVLIMPPIHLTDKLSQQNEDLIELLNDFSVFINCTLIRDTCQ